MDPVLVKDVGWKDGQISWTRTTDGQVTEVNETQLLFVLQSSNTSRFQQPYAICVLAEDPEKPREPYRLSLLVADSIPDHLLQHNIIRELPPHLRIGQQNKVDVLVSVKSGTDLALTFWEGVLSPLLRLCREALRTPAPAQETEETGDDQDGPHVLVTQSAHSIRDYAQGLAGSGGDRAASDVSRTIVLLSGDGGVYDLLNGFAGHTDSNDGGASSQPIIALLPLGTGNALFHSLHKPIAAAADSSPLVLALRTLFLGVPADLPTFRASFSAGARITSFGAISDGTASGSSGEQVDDPQAQLAKRETPVDVLHGAIVASYGFHASVVYESDTPEYRVHGAKRFGMVAQDLLREAHPYTAHVDVRRSGSTELQRLPREAHGYVLATLVSNLERAFCISPGSQPLDCRLRLVHFGPIGGERTMAAMMAAYDGGKHVEMKWDDGERVGYEQIDELRVEVLESDERWRKVCIDGTIVDIPQGGHMTVATARQAPFKVLVDARIVGQQTR